MMASERDKRLMAVGSKQERAATVGMVRAIAELEGNAHDRVVMTVICDMIERGSQEEFAEDPDAERP